MTGIVMNTFNFKNRTPGLCRFHDRPRLNLTQAFARISRTLYPGAGIGFYKNSDGISVCILPFTGQLEPRLAYQFFPAHNAVVIRRIHAGENRRTGIGTAMITSQLPVWEEMGARYIHLLTHSMGEGFYKKLGFVNVPLIPEYDRSLQNHSLPMQMDLHDPAQRKIFDDALMRKRPLKTLISPEI